MDKNRRCSRVSGLRHLLASLVLLVAITISCTFLIVPPALAEGVPCDPEPTDMLISYGSFVTCEISPAGDQDVFRFIGDVAEAIVIRAAASVGGAPCIEIFDPLGGFVDSVCGGPARVDIQLQETGLYTSIVDEASGSQTMTYAVTLERLVPPSPGATVINPNDLLGTTIDPPADMDLFYFMGTAGDVVSLETTGIAGGAPCLELFDPFGNPVDALCGSPIQINETLSETGLHTVLVSEASASNLLTYQLSYVCIVGACESLPTFFDDFESGDTSAWSGSVP